MTLPTYQYKIGTDTSTHFKYLTEIGISSNPLPTYRPFSVADKLGDLTTEGNGFPVITWHWAVMRIAEADILEGYLSGELSVPIYIRSRLNRLTTNAYTWRNFSGIMEWVSGDEDIESRRILNLTIQFTGLVQLTEPT